MAELPPRGADFQEVTSLWERVVTYSSHYQGVFELQPGEIDTLKDR